MLRKVKRSRTIRVPADVVNEMIFIKKSDNIFSNQEALKKMAADARVGREMGLINNFSFGKLSPVVGNKKKRRRK